MKESHSFPFRRWCFNIFFQILGNMIKVSRPSLFVEPTLCSAESQKNHLWWKRKNWKKEFDNILYQIACNLRRSFFWLFYSEHSPKNNLRRKGKQAIKSHDHNEREKKRRKIEVQGKKLASAKALSEYNTVKDVPCNKLNLWWYVRNTNVYFQCTHYQVPGIIQWRMYK